MCNNARQAYRLEKGGNEDVHFQNKTKVSGRGTPAIRTQRCGQHHEERYRRGVGKGQARTLYTYFNRKEDVYYAVIEAELERLSDKLDEVAGKENQPAR